MTSPTAIDHPPPGPEGDRGGLWGEAVVDVDAVAENAAALADRARRPVMAVVKADAYGHGLLPCARAALAGGASWLGVAQLDEAFALRAAGVSAPLLSWLLTPGSDLARALRERVALGVSSRRQLDAVVAAASESGQVAELHLKVDTGLSRNGCAPADWPELCAAAARAETDGYLAVAGVFSHLAWADSPQHPTVDRQAGRFADAIAEAERAGLRPSWRHLANSAATLTRPDLAYDLVRPGLAVYGLSPVPELGAPADYGLRPAMTLRGALSVVKPVPAGEGVSYGHSWTTPDERLLGLLPLGYADGLPRHASGRGAEVLVRGAGRAERVPVVGRVCMDQVVLDLGPAASPRLAAVEGDEVVVFGPGGAGEPTAQDWAVAADTISYEIVTRLGVRLPRRHTGRAGTAEVGGPPWP